MKEIMISKGLVIGVILLFTGISIQPAIAVNPISSDDEEDCSICPKVSNLQEVEKFQELSDRFTLLKEVSKKYVSGLSWNFPISRGILFMIAFFISNIANVLYNLPIQPFKVLWILVSLFIVIGFLGNGIGCWDFEWMTPPYH